MNKNAEFRFYEELNDFLPKDKRKQSFTYHFFGNPTVKDAIEACGIPHPEVELIIANGKSVDFDYHLADGDQISVYPEFESLDISPLLKLRETPLRNTKFIVDVNLGKLAKFLRLVGFDTLYCNQYKDKDIVRLSKNEKRIILTRDQHLLKHKLITRGYWVRNIDPDKQLIEVVKRLDLISSISPFVRCMVCNGSLKSVKKKDIIDVLPENTAKYYSEFYRCKCCDKIYWPGSHYQKMYKKIEKLKQEKPT
jgi:uncharacterized protein with PIN domain